MLTGLCAGITWALETVILGAALLGLPATAGVGGLVLAPFVCTFIHDAFSALCMTAINTASGNLKGVFNTLKSKNCLWLILASAIGGPCGMTGYVLAVNYMGASVGAVASAVYPAIGSVLACVFLKEKVRWYQWIFLALTLFGVFGLGYSPELDIKNFWLGILGVVMCAFGWGIEGVILSKCLKDDSIKSEYALQIRQTTSAVIYALLIIPAIGGVEFVGDMFLKQNIFPLLLTATAAVCATVSYLFYYRAISKLGVTKAMALNITYTAWAIVFGVVILGDTGLLNPVTVTCAVIVVVCGIFAAADMRELFGKKRK